MRLLFLLAMPFIFTLPFSSATLASVTPCGKYLETMVPKADLPKPDDEKEFKSCNSAGEYYGLLTSPNSFVRARKCAYFERDNGWQKQSLAPGVLIMLYANGHEVTQNFDLALRFVCESQLTVFEKTKWIDYLESKRASKDKEEIDFCERFFEDSYRQPCSDFRKQRQAAVREKKFKQLTNQFKDTQKSKFTHLLEVTRKFIKSDAAWKNPGHSEGGERTTLIEAHEAYAWEQFEIEIEHLEKQKRLRPPPELLSELDERLNKKYREYKRDLKPDEKNPLVEAQRLWIEFRDAYVDFAVSRYEPKDTNAWHAYLTLKRIEELTF